MSVRGNVFDLSDREQLLGRVGTLDAGAQARWGRMSAHQALCHQADALEMALGRRLPAPYKPPMPPFLLRMFALYLPFRWPKGVPTLPEFDQERGGTPPKEFVADRDRLIHLIHEFSDLPNDLPSHAHPAFGRMSHAEWGRWAYRHSDHHLRQFDC